MVSSHFIGASFFQASVTCCLGMYRAPIWLKISMYTWVRQPPCTSPSLVHPAQRTVLYGQAVGDGNGPGLATNGDRDLEEALGIDSTFDSQQMGVLDAEEALLPVGSVTSASLI